MAGGSGSRLRPLTNAISKQVIPIYDKPMIYYPLTTLILAGITDVRIVVTQEHKSSFERLLGDGSDWGLSLHFSIQSKPDGLAGALMHAEDHLTSSRSAVILGDNLFYGAGAGTSLSNSAQSFDGALLFCKHVEDPQYFGVVDLDPAGEVIGLEEKPKNPKSNLVSTGLYFYDETVIQRAKELRPSVRGELEITDLNLSYLKDGTLKAHVLHRSTVWLDTGTIEGLSQASEFVRVVEERQGHKIGSPEEAAWRQGLIDSDQLLTLAGALKGTRYGQYLEGLVK